MRILVDASVLQIDVTGIGRVVLGLHGACLHLKPELQTTLIHRNKLLCRLPPGLHDAQVAPWLPKRWWRGSAIPGYCAIHKPDIVHFPWNEGVMDLPRGCRKVLTLNDVIPLALPEIYFSSASEEDRFRARAQENIDRADLVITISERSRDDIVRHLKVDKEPLVVYPAVRMPEPPAKSGLQLPQEGYFLYFGGYEKRKGLDALVRVYHSLHKERLVTVPLIVAGKKHRLSDAFHKEMESAVADGAVIELGYVEDEDLVTLMQKARALIYPTLYEGFGLPPLEAMSVGCPVVTTRAGSVPEICGQAALYAEGEGDDALARAVVEMNGDEALRQRCVERGFEQSSKFTWEKSAAVFLDAMNELVAGKR